MCLFNGQKQKGGGNLWGQGRTSKAFDDVWPTVNTFSKGLTKMAIPPEPYYDDNVSITLTRCVYIQGICFSMVA